MTPPTPTGRRPEAEPPEPLVIPFLRNRCPNCTSREIRTYSTKRTGEVVTRWHYCPACGRERWWKTVDAD